MRRVYFGISYSNSATLLKEYPIALITNAVRGKIDVRQALTPETSMTQITLSDLPETVQNLINQAQKTGEPLTIIQNGIPFAIISPIQKKSLIETLSSLEPLDEDCYYRQCS